MITFYSTGYVVSVMVTRERAWIKCFGNDQIWQVIEAKALRMKDDGEVEFKFTRRHARRQNFETLWRAAPCKLPRRETPMPRYR